MWILLIVRLSVCFLGLSSNSGVLDDVEDEDAIDFIFGRGRLSLDDGVG